MTDRARNVSNLAKETTEATTEFSSSLERVPPKIPRTPRMKETRPVLKTMKSVIDIFEMYF